MTRDNANAPKRRPIIDLLKLCPEAQADGVPCPELGRDCEICEHAMSLADATGASGDTDAPVGC